MNNALSALLAAGALMGASGGLSALLPGRGDMRDRAFAILMVAGGAVGSAVAFWCLLAGARATYVSAWLLPVGHLALRLDPLSAAFLVPVFGVPAVAAAFGTAYWRESENPGTAPRLRISFALMTAGMVGVILAQSGVVLLLAWEVMALSAFVAIAAEDTKSEVREGAWVYFVATHVGTLSLLGFFTLLSSATGSFDLMPLPPGMSTGRTATWLFLLGLAGFGMKAGAMPLHVWLPGAHANAPSHVSAILSGVMLKVGVYGLFRTCWILAPGPVWWSWVLIGLGATSAILGIASALAQRDYKRLLAYSSIENIGIIVVALGVAMLGRATGNAPLAAFGIAAALLHVWNHSLFKSLLFLVSGALLHACGTRRMGALGGLVKRMPRTAAAAAVACIAISALPPLNGFVSEWLLFRGVIHGLGEGAAELEAPLAVTIVAISLASALALATFVKFFGMMFLGQERSTATTHAHDPSPAMLAPMAVLALLCIVIGALPRIALVPLERAARLWVGDTQGNLSGLAAAGASVATACLVALATAGGSLALFLWLRACVRRNTPIPVNTWDCGYAAPSPRMQYGESSLAEFTGRLFEGVLIPRRARPRIGGPFPAPSEFGSETPDVVLDRGIAPTLTYATRLAMRLRVLQPGRVQSFVLYILLGLFVLLVVSR